MSLEIRGDDLAFLRGARRRVARPRGTLRVVDLFSGCGGLTLGVEEAGKGFGLALDVRLAAEVDVAIAGVYARNFGVQAHRIARDVKARFDRAVGRSPSRAEEETVALVGRGLDVLVGGPPCQGHSTLNNHTRGDDPKNQLYLAMVRAAELLKPRVVLIENVPAVQRDRGRVVERTTDLLAQLGYRVESAVVSVADIGVAQLRQRHLLVGVRGRQVQLQQAIDRSRRGLPRDLDWAIADLVGVTGSSLDEPGRLTPDNLKRARYLLRKDVYDLPNDLRPPCQQGVHKYKSMYGRLRWDAPAQTITTGFGSPGQGRYLHPDEPRTLTPHEAARIQFFPDWFDFSSLPHRRDVAHAIGNAVPPKLSFVILHHQLEREHGASAFRRSSTSGAGAALQLFG